MLGNIFNGVSLRLMEKDYGTGEHRKFQARQ